MPKKIVEKIEEARRVEGEELSNDTKTLITVLCLVTVYPVGLILMFVWMKWEKWLKFLVALPALLALLVPIVVFLAAVILGVQLFTHPEKFKRIDNVRNIIIREMEMVPTRQEITPTKMMIKPTIKIVK